MYLGRNSITSQGASHDHDFEIEKILQTTSEGSIAL